MNVQVATRWNVLSELEPADGKRVLAWPGGLDAPVRAIWDQDGRWHIEEEENGYTLLSTLDAYTTDVWTAEKMHPMIGSPSQPLRPRVRQEVDPEIVKRFEDVLRRSIMPRIEALEARDG